HPPTTHSYPSIQHPPPTSFPQVVYPDPHSPTVPPAQDCPAGQHPTSLPTSSHVSSSPQQVEGRLMDVQGEVLGGQVNARAKSWRIWWRAFCGVGVGVVGALRG
ncbi:uncharacterized protein BDW47DRAFT_112110, partial [Aspergillus candidus]